MDLQPAVFHPACEEAPAHVQSALQRQFCQLVALKGGTRGVWEVPQSASEHTCGRAPVWSRRSASPACWPRVRWSPRQLPATPGSQAGGAGGGRRLPVRRRHLHGCMSQPAFHTLQHLGSPSTPLHTHAAAVAGAGAAQCVEAEVEEGSDSGSGCATCSADESKCEECSPSYGLASDGSCVKVRAHDAATPPIWLQLHAGSRLACDRAAPCSSCCSHLCPR